MKLAKDYLNRFRKNLFPLLVIVLFVKIGFIYVKPFFESKKLPPPVTSQIVSLCLKTYKEAGLTGLKILSEKSYSEYRKNRTLQELEKAAIIDMFSHKLDSAMAQYVGFPKDEYFSGIEIKERLRINVKSTGLSYEDLNNKIRIWGSDLDREMKKLD